MTALRVAILLAAGAALHAGAAAAQDFCPLGPSATIESRSVFPGGFVYIQRMTLGREAQGAGIDGRWIAMSYEQINEYPLAVPTTGLPATTPGVPGYRDCATDAPTPQSIRTLCANARTPFDVRGGQIYEVGTNRRVGQITTSTGVRTMSLDIMAGAGSPHPPMTGHVQDGAQIEFDVSLQSIRRHPVHDASTVTLRIAPRAPPPGFSGSTDVRVSSNVSRHRPQLDVSRVGQAAIARITLLGNARERTEAAAATTVIAEAPAGGCSYSREWNLGGLFLALSVTP